jgi:hypothetical protein
MSRPTSLVASCAWLAAVAIACSDSMSPPAAPSPTAPPTPIAPPAVVNTPPAIKSVTSSSPRVEADEQLVLTAFVEDAEAPIDQFKYEWSASPAAGSFTALNGPQAAWTAPRGQPTPAVYDLTVKVVETYLDNGTSRQNEVTSAPISVHYNDSPRELSELGTDFLVNRFANYGMSAAETVANFSDSCPGKSAEREDVENNRKFFQILSGSFTPSSHTFNEDRTRGTVSGACVFEDVVKATGQKQRVTGVCTLTAVYESWRWFLCDSGFAGTGTTPLSVRYRVPGAR